MTKRLDRGDVFFLSLVDEGSQGNKMILRKIFYPVVDDDRASDDFGMREFLAGEKNLHDEIFKNCVLSIVCLLSFPRFSLWILFYYIFYYQEATKK